MEKPIRRADRATSLEDARALLMRATYGVLSTVDSDGLPYATPLSYACVDNRIYFHCAHEGRKLDNIAANPRVAFCVIGDTQTLPREFATRYESAVAFGKAQMVTGDEKRAALVLLLEKYSPEFMASGMKYLEGKFAQTTVVRIDIDHLTGKARR